MFGAAKPTPPLRRRWGDWPYLLLAALFCGGLFFTSLGKLWPLVPGDLQVQPARLHTVAANALRAEGISVAGYAWDWELSVSEDTLSYVERSFGQARTRTLLADSNDALPLTEYTLIFKRYGEANALVVWLRPDGSLVGWRRELQEDEPNGAATNTTEARRLARAALSRVVGAAYLPDWKETGTSDRTLPRRVDHLFTFERIRSVAPDLRERAQVRIAGDRVASVTQTVVAPASADRDRRRRDAPRNALNAVGSILFGAAVLGAFTVFVLRLRDGTARLARAVLWSGTVFLLGLAASLLRTADTFGEWDPLTPRTVALLQHVVSLVQENIWTLAVLVAVAAAGDALDRDSKTNRGETLWEMTRGRLWNPLVGAASARGFLIGCICGGVMTAAVLLLTRFAEAHVALQPRGFFFFALNSPLPALSTLLYFLQVALLEELGYRYFAGAWLLRYTRRRWLAIFLPALVYGLTHTSLTFLPPEEPFWARALVMTLIGCLWGWAFLRYDALTVVTSHLTADLFIFNWPRLASGDPALIAQAILTIAVPLAPALGLLGGLWRRRTGEQVTTS